jgi:uncharacterized protein YjbI with pentapeptide repeats
MQFLKKFVKEGKDLRGSFISFKVLDLSELKDVDFSGCVFYKCVVGNPLEDEDIVQLNDIESVQEFNSNARLVNHFRNLSFGHFTRDLRYAVLDYLSVKGRNNIYRSFNMDHASLRLIRLKLLSFYHSSFKNCDFQTALLEGMTFENCSLSGSSFDFAEIYYCEFIECDLTNSSFSNHNERFARTLIQESSFKGSSLIDVDLKDIGSLETVVVKNVLFTDESRKEELEKRGAIWIGKGMQLNQVLDARIDIPKFTIENRDLSNSSIKNLKIGECVFKNVDFSGTHFYACAFESHRVAFENCDFRNCTFSFCAINNYFTNCNFEGSLFEGCDGNFGLFKHSSLKDVSFIQTNMFFKYTDSNEREKLEFNGLGAYLGPEIKIYEGEKLDDLGHIDLSGVSFEGATLFGVSFMETDLRNVNFKNANLQESNFSSANLEGANLEGANLKDAIYNTGSTILPKSITQDQIASMSPFTHD